MSNSPGGIQAGRDLNLNVNTDRRMTNTAAAMMVEGLKVIPCQVTVGVLGMGGEPSYLADQLLEIAKGAVPTVMVFSTG
jgi:hypothetical protein